MRNPFQKLLAKFRSIKKHGCGKWGLLAPHGHEESLKFSSFLKWCSDFEIVSQKFSIGDPFQKLLVKFFVCQKTAANCWRLHVVFLFELNCPWVVYPKIYFRILIHENHCCGDDCRVSDR